MATSLRKMRGMAMRAARACVAVVDKSEWLLHG
jgi:hypothetical protein